LKSIVYQEHLTTPNDMRTRIRMTCANIPVMTLMQAERAFTGWLRLCTCGDVNLDITDKPENNDFI